MVQRYNFHLKAQNLSSKFSQGNVPRPGVVPKFSDLEVVALSMASEAVGIDSESLLSSRLKEYGDKMPNLISRRQYNDRRKFT